MQWFNARRHWIMLGAGTALALAFLLDDMVQQWILLPSHTPMFSLARGISHWGDWPVLITALLVVALGLHLSRHRLKAQLVLILALAGALSGITATVIRTVSGRTRPTSHETPGFYGVWYHSRMIMGQHEFGSFPSGHTATAAGIAGALLLFRRRAGVAGFALAGLLGWSRIAMNSHHLSDVVASMIMGLGGGWFTWSILVPWAARKWTKSPGMTSIEASIRPNSPPDYSPK